MFRKSKRKCWHPKILQNSHENVTDLRIIIKKKRDRYTHMDKSETSIVVLEGERRRANGIQVQTSAT